MQDRALDIRNHGLPPRLCLGGITFKRTQGPACDFSAIIGVPMCGNVGIIPSKMPSVGPAHEPRTSPGVSQRLQAFTPCVSRGVSLSSLGLLTSGASDTAFARNLASCSLAEAQAAVPHGPHQARLPHRRRLNPRPNAPSLSPFGAVATEFSFISGFYLILSLRSSVVR